MYFDKTYRAILIISLFSFIITLASYLGGNVRNIAPVFVPLSFVVSIILSVIVYGNISAERDDKRLYTSTIYSFYLYIVAYCLWSLFWFFTSVDDSSASFMIVPLIASVIWMNAHIVSISMLAIYLWVIFIAYLTVSGHNEFL